MENLSLCRICLAADIRLCSIASHLRDMYERITALTLKSQDLLSTNSFSIVLAAQVSIEQLQDSTECDVKEEAPEIIYDAELDQQYTKDNATIAPAQHRRQLEDPLEIIKREPNVNTGTEFIKVEIVNSATEEKFWKSDVAGTSYQSADLEKMDRNDTRICTSNLKKRRLPTQKIATGTTSRKLNKNKQLKGEIAVNESVDNNTVIRKYQEVRDETDNQTNKEDISIKKDEKSKALLKRSHAVKNRFQCSVCNKKFNHKTSFEIHTRTHSGEKPYMCDVCTKCFVGRNALTIHYRTHTGEKPYVCNVCKKSFSTNTAMKKHIRIHTGEKPYICNICKKRFIQKTSLDCHIRAHTGDKPYTCKICNKSFKQKSQLDHHIRAHTGDKPFSCDVCKKRFTKKITMKEHIRVHTGEKPYICSVCHKGFVRKSALTIHIRTHTGDKPYMCHMCNKCFRSRSTLTDHIRTHAGDKPFSCDVCKKCFTKKATLTGHIRLHTTKKP